MFYIKSIEKCIFPRGKHYEDIIGEIEALLPYPAVKLRNRVLEDIDWTMSFGMDKDWNRFAFMNELQIDEYYRGGSICIKDTKYQSRHIDQNARGIIQDHCEPWDSPEQLLRYLYCLRRYNKIIRG